MLEDHLAEARITSDRLSDPILPGDKLYTPLWSPGRKRHFALAGFFNIDGQPRGDNDLQKVLRLLRANGCDVDCYTKLLKANGDEVESYAKYLEDKDQGEAGEYEMVGKITPDTTYLVLGADCSGEAGTPRPIAITQMLKTAEHLRIPIMQFNDLLQTMGWKNDARTALAASD